MNTHELTRVVPNEDWQLVIEFDQAEHRLFDARIAREERNWQSLAYPNTLKHFSYSERSVAWPGLGEITADYLYRNSVALTAEKLENQTLRLSYKNQAPTAVHKTHHVYAVYLHPFSRALFDVEESIGGGHCEMGVSKRMMVEELLARPDWRQHFHLSGCAWAIPVVETRSTDLATLSDLLVREICRREGEAER